MVGLALILVLALLRLSEQDPKIVAGVGRGGDRDQRGCLARERRVAHLGNVNLVLFFVVLVGASASPSEFRSRSRSASAR